MKSIDKLRGLPFHGTNGFGNCVTASKEEINSIADEIEAEIKRDYMRLPRDADDEPIHVGNTCEMDGYKFMVRQLTTDGSCWWAVDKFGEFYIAELCRHVKPRTLEDVLASYRFDAQNIYEDPRLDGNQRVDELEALDGKVAAEIRELMGVEGGGDA